MDKPVAVIDKQKTINEIIVYFDKILAAYVFYLNAIYDTENIDEILVFWECLNKLLSIHGGIEVLNEYLTEGQGKYKVIKTKLRKLNLM